MHLQVITTSECTSFGGVEIQGALGRLLLCLHTKDAGRFSLTLGNAFGNCLRLSYGVLLGAFFGLLKTHLTYCPPLTSHLARKEEWNVLVAASRDSFLEGCLERKVHVHIYLRIAGASMRTRVKGKGSSVRKCLKSFATVVQASLDLLEPVPHGLSSGLKTQQLAFSSRQKRD